MPFSVLPPLTLIPCNDCGGEGYAEDERGASECKICFGCGEVEVCGGCREVPEVKGGLETCGCSLGLPAIIQDRVPTSDPRGEAA